MKTLILSLVLSLLTISTNVAAYDTDTEMCMIDVIHQASVNAHECTSLKIFGICEICIKGVSIPACQDNIDQCRATHQDAVEICDLNPETLCS
jgi:hypothetical protein